MLKFLGKAYVVINLMFIVMLGILAYNNHLPALFFILAVTIGGATAFFAKNQKCIKTLLITELFVFLVSGGIITYFLIGKDYLTAFVAFFCVALTVDGFWLGFFNNKHIEKGKNDQKNAGYVYIIMDLFFLIVFIFGIIDQEIDVLIGLTVIAIAMLNLLFGLKLNTRTKKLAMITQSIIIIVLGNVLMLNYLNSNFSSAFYYFIAGGMIIDFFWGGMLVKSKAD